MRNTHSHFTKIFGLFLALVFFTSLVNAQAPPASAYQTDLVAGNPKNGLVDAGDVFVWNDGINLYVQYVVSGDWYLTWSHLHVATSFSGIP